MRTKLAFGTLFLLACSEAPRMQPMQPVPDAPDLAVPSAADLTGVANPGVDLAIASLAISAISPRLASTIGRDRVTITGVGFDARTEVTFGGARADIESVSPTSIVALTPPSLPWGVPTTVVVRRGTDGARVTNSNAANSPTAFRFYASTLQYTWTARVNPNSRVNARVPLVGDLNNDGRPDFIATYINDATYNVMINNGSGDFINTVNESTTPNGPGTQKGVLVDLNGDNNLDMVVADESITWNYNLGNGMGRMTLVGNMGYNGAGGACSGANAPTPIRLSSAMYPDIVLACNNNNNIRIWNNQFNGGNPSAIFGTQNAGNQVTIATPASPRHLMVADLNNDGKQDLIVMTAGNGATTLSWFINQGTTLPSTATGSVGTNSLNQQPFWGICRDVNNDGFADCLVSDQNTNTVRVFLNNNGVLQLPGNNGVVSVGANPMEVNLDDMNGDGQLDLLVANYNASTTNIIPGRGDGTFGNIVAADGRLLTQRATVAPPGCRYSWSVRTGDFDGDGLMDFITNCEQNERGETSFGGFHVFRNASR